jgi:hypothetical protein
MFFNLCKPTLTSLFLLVSLTISTCFGQAKAVIKGPNEVLAGTLLFLSHADAVGDNKVWIIPDELKATSATCDSNIFFSIPTPGTYSFGLIVADKNAAIDYAFHKVIVKANGVFPPSTPADPKPPQPSVDYKALREASITGLKTIQDWNVTNSLRTSIESALMVSTGKSFDETRKAIQGNIGVVLGSRTPDQYRVDWFLHWRVPVEKELALIPKEKYREAVAELVKTLCKECIQ